MFGASLDIKRAHVAVDQISQEAKQSVRRIGKLNSFQKHTRLILVNLNQFGDKGEVLISARAVPAFPL